MNAPAPNPPQQRVVVANPLAGGWWSRNWKWFVPFMFVCMTVMFVIGGVLAITDAFGRVREHPVYLEALERVRSDKRVAAALGEPIETGWAFSGDFDDKLGRGGVRFNIEGPSDAASVLVQARRADGTWHIDTLHVYPRNAPAGQQTIVLIPKPAE